MVNWLRFQRLVTLAFIFCLVGEAFYFFQPSYILPVYASTSETRYMRNDNVFNTTAPSAANDVYIASGSGTVYFGIRVFVFHIDNSQTEITSGAAVSVGSRSSSGAVTGAGWTCPTINLTKTDKIRIMGLASLATNPPTAFSMNFTSGQLGASYIVSGSWVAHYYLLRIGSAPYDYDAEWGKYSSSYSYISGFNIQYAVFPTYTNLVPANNYSPAYNATVLFNGTWTSSDVLKSYVFSWNATPATAYYGKTSTGTSTQTGAANRKEGQRFVAQTSGSLFRISVYLAKQSSGTAHVKTAVYSNFGNTANTTASAVSSEVTCSSTTRSWYNFTFPTVVNIWKGRTYTLAVLGDSALYFNYSTITYSYHNYCTNQYSDGFSTSSYGTTTTQARDMLIYASINVSSGAWANYTYSWSGSPTTANSNFTRTFSNTEFMGKFIAWRFYVKTATQAWNSTPIRYVFYWETAPPVSKYDGGTGAYPCRNSFFYNATDTGGRPAFYVAYVNTTTGGNWHFNIKAYDYYYGNWTPMIDAGVTGVNDIHTSCAISILPDKRIIFDWDYPTEGFKISLNNASTCSNLTKLLTEWGTSITYYGANYPWISQGSNTTLIFGRYGSASSNSWGYYQWVDKSFAHCYADDYHYSFDNISQYMHFVGGSPYTDENPSTYVYSTTGASSTPIYGKIYFATAVKQEGALPRDIYNETYYSQAYLKIYAKGSATSVKITPHFFDGFNDHALTETALTTSWAWYSWNISDYVVTLNYLGTGYAYAKVIVSSGYSTGNASIQATRIDLKMTGLAPFFKLVSSGADGACYFDLTQGHNGKIMMAGEDYNYTSGIKHNVLFLYDVNGYGNDWRSANGTSLGEFTISANTIRIVSTTWSTTQANINSPFYDEASNRVSVFRIVYDYNTPKFVRRQEEVVYSATLGSVGTWTRFNCTLENGTAIFQSSTIANTFNFAYDMYYKRLSVWFPWNGIITKFVCLANNLTIFRQVWADSNSQNVAYTEFTTPINNNPEGYEIVIGEYRYVIGKIQFGEYNTTATHGILYGSKFTATFTGEVDGIRWWTQPKVIAGASIHGSASIYDSNFNRLGITLDANIVTGKYINAWSEQLQFATSVSLIYGQSYWIVFNNTDVNDKLTYLYSNTASYTAFSFASNNMPSSLNPASLTFLNQSITIYAYQTALLIRGTGEVAIPVYSNVGPAYGGFGASVTFHVLWDSTSDLVKATFYWNYTGVMLLNGTETWANAFPLEAYSNFTRTLPATGSEILWYVVATNTIGAIGNTTSQTLWLSQTYKIDLSLSTSWPMTLFANAIFHVASTFASISSLASAVHVFYLVSTILLSNSLFSFISNAVYHISVALSTALNIVTAIVRNLVVNLSFSLASSFVVALQNTYVVLLSFASAISYSLLAKAVYYVVIALTGASAYGLSALQFVMTVVSLSLSSAVTFTVYAQTTYHVFLAFASMVQNTVFANAIYVLLFTLGSASTFTLSVFQTVFVKVTLTLATSTAYVLNLIATYHVDLGFVSGTILTLFASALRTVALTLSSASNFLVYFAVGIHKYASLLFITVSTFALWLSVPTVETSVVLFLVLGLIFGVAVGMLLLYRRRKVE